MSVANSVFGALNTVGNALQPALNRMSSDPLEHYVNTKVFPQSQYRSPFTRVGTSQFTPTMVGSISVPSPQPKENLVTVNPSSDDGSRAAGLLAGQSGLVLAPLGRQGAGGLGGTALLGR